MKFFNLLRKTFPAVNDDPQPLFFHEDDFCQVELSPKENLASLTEEADKVTDFARQHFDGVGYTDIYIRSKHRLELRERKIRQDELEAVIVGSDLKRAPAVLSGYGENYRVKLDDTVGFGEGYSAIYFDVKGDVVENIWLTGDIDAEAGKFRNSLVQIGQRWNLILMDWNLSIAVDLTDNRSAEDYFTQLTALK